MDVMDVIDPAPPSGDALAEAARRIGAAYPGLYAHQRAGIAFLLARRRAILADDMGLGKTRQAIIAAREAAPSGPFLVICPASVKLNWRREVRLVEPRADVRVVDGRAGWEPGRRWTVVGYDLLGRVEGCLRATAWGAIVVDEAHYIKNDSQRSRRVLRLLGADGSAGPSAEPEAAYLLTGAPISGRPRDLFNPLKAVRHPPAASYCHYARRYCAAYDNGFGLDDGGASNLEELAQVISGVLLRRTEDEALDLPPKVRSWVPVAVPAKAVGGLEAPALGYLARNPARSGPTWATFLGLLNRARHAAAVAKVPATVAAVRERLEADEKVAVFSSYTAVVEAVAAAFGARAVAITGADSAADRQAAVDALQADPSVRVLAGNLQAAGVGVNLTAATHVVFNDLDLTPGSHWQAEDRIYRIGQARPVFVTYLLAVGSLDAHVAALREEKARSIGVLEGEAARHATLVEQVVEAAARGERPSPAPRDPARLSAGRSVGRPGDTPDWLARSGRGLGAADLEGQVFEIPSRSRPGEVNVVTVVRGAARCTCPGFAFRGGCSHVASVARRLAGRGGRGPGAAQWAAGMGSPLRHGDARPGRPRATRPAEPARGAGGGGSAGLASRVGASPAPPGLPAVRSPTRTAGGSAWAAGRARCSEARLAASPASPSAA